MVRSSPEIAPARSLRVPTSALGVVLRAGAIPPPRVEPARRFLRGVVSWLRCRGWRAGTLQVRFDPVAAGDLADRVGNLQCAPELQLRSLDAALRHEHFAHQPAGVGLPGARAGGHRGGQDGSSRARATAGSPSARAVSTGPTQKRSPPEANGLPYSMSD